MDFKRLYHITFGGVHMNQKFPYMLHGVLMLLLPKALYRRKRPGILRRYESMAPDEKAYIDERVSYYCKLPADAQLPADALTLAQHTYGNKVGHTVYFFDTYEQTRYFPLHLRWAKRAGDVFFKLPEPTVCKSRLIVAPGETCNEVLLNLNKVRHFKFIDDPFSFDEKQPKVLFRGACHGKPMRELFLKTFIQHPLFDLKDSAKDSTNPPEWRQFKEMTIYDQLGFRYIMALEGNDVASNLKWVMSSNSIAISTPMTCETWFMEGRLIPDYHFIQIKDDFSDLVEKIEYYNAHPDEAKAIIAHAHEWVDQFRNKDREQTIATLTLQRYFQQTHQL